jgi:hypothetical protein
MKKSGFVDVEATEPVDVFKDAPGETNARQFGVMSMRFFARKPA